jgi:hypothetical protein
MMLLSFGVTIAASVAIGWLVGYNRACRAHGWYLPKTFR